jgi:uncharacterized RDD family membrane protein YckC
MKCPKCGYLGFESVDRCRNCGYDFSLSPLVDVLELPLKIASANPPASPTSLSAASTDRGARQPLDDLSFLDEAMRSEPVRFSGSMKPDVPDNLDNQRRMAGGRAPAPPSEDLPLFGAAISDDVPLITRPSPPRPPLAVRRATPDVPRSRSVSSRPATLDLDLGSPARATASDGAARSTEAALHQAHTSSGQALASDGEDAAEDATIGARFAAFVIDALILAAIDAVVVYFTMQICGIGLEDLRILPVAPLVAFLVVENGGYLVAFTAGGQTLGKMATGIKVVSAEPRSSLDVGRAFVRELVWLVLAAPAGLGLLTVLGRDHRGVHDRFAGTRVVRA